MKERVLVLLACLFASFTLAMAQNSTVSGTVVDENNEPVIGASILVEGTARGTITDIEGKFTISSVPASAKNLQVSYVGMRTQLVPITSGNIQIVLKNDAEVLDEVMVVALTNQLGQQISADNQRAILPIPQHEIDMDSALAQNPGY